MDSLLTQTTLTVDILAHLFNYSFKKHVSMCLHTRVHTHTPAGLCSECGHGRIRRLMWSRHPRVTAYRPILTASWCVSF